MIAFAEGMAFSKGLKIILVCAFFSNGAGATRGDNRDVEAPQSVETGRVPTEAEISDLEASGNSVVAAIGNGIDWKPSLDQFRLVLINLQNTGVTFQLDPIQSSDVELLKNIFRSLKFAQVASNAQDWNTVAVLALCGGILLSAITCGSGINAPVTTGHHVTPAAIGRLLDLGASLVNNTVLR